MKSLVDGGGGKTRIEFDSDIQIPGVNDRELINGYPVPIHIDDNYSVFSVDNPEAAYKDIVYSTTVYIKRNSIEFKLSHTKPSGEFLNKIISRITAFLNSYFGDGEENFVPEFDEISNNQIASYINRSPRCVHPLLDDSTIVSLFSKSDMGISYDVFTEDEASMRGVDINQNQLKLVTINIPDLDSEITVLPYDGRASVEEEISKVKNLLESNPFGQSYESLKLAYNVKTQLEKEELNKFILEKLRKIAPEINSKVRNPYEAARYPIVDDLRPWFAKYGWDAVDFWNVYVDYLFSQSPINTYIEELESFIESSDKTKVQYLEMWVDLMKCLSHEYPPLRGESEIEKLVSTVTGSSKSQSVRNHIEDSYQIPWKEIDWIEPRVRKQIFRNYDYDDFSYDRDILEEGELLKIALLDQSANIIFEADEYNSLFGDGTLSPKSWISYPIAAQPHSSNSEVTNRRELSEVLENKSARPLTLHEIEKSQTVDKSDLTTVVYRNENDKKIQSSTSFGQDIVENVYMVRENPQDRSKYVLSDFEGDEEVYKPLIVVKDEYWFTGTAVSEFPLRLSVSEYEEPRDFDLYEEFPNNHVTFKSDRKVFIVPAWDKIANTKFRKSDFESVDKWKRDAIEKSDYSPDSTLIVTKHRIA